MITRRTFLSKAVVAVMAPPMIQAKTSPFVRLGLVADPQYADVKPWQSRFYRQSLGKLTEAIIHFNSQDLGFCVNVGDTIDRHWTSFDDILKPFTKSRHTFHHLLGNHDFAVADEHKSRVPERLGLHHRYYSRSVQDYCFVMMDTTDISLYAQPGNSEAAAIAKARCQPLAETGAANAQTWNGAVGVKQLKWFEDTCRDAATKDHKVVVFAHHPVFPDNPHNEWNSADLLQVVERNRNIVAWFNGHNHAGAFGSHHGVPFVTLKGMVETERTNAFATLELLPDRMILQGFGRETSREVVFRNG